MPDARRVDSHVGVLHLGGFYQFAHGSRRHSAEVGDSAARLGRDYCPILKYMIQQYKE